MYLNFCCNCGAVFESDSEFEDAMLLFAYRFANAHTGCGFMLPAANVETAVKLELGWEDLPPEDEAATLDEDAGVEAPGD